MSGEMEVEISNINNYTNTAMSGEMEIDDATIMDMSCPPSDVKFNMLKLDSFNKNNDGLWILLAQLFIEYYFFNTTEFDVTITQEPPDTIFDVSLLFDTKFINYDANTSIASPNISIRDIQMIINNIYRYYVIFNSSIKHNFFLIVNNLISKLKRQIVNCNNYLSVKSSSIAQFNDSRNYSIQLLIKYLILHQDCSDIHIIKFNKDYSFFDLDSYMTHSHVFIINHTDIRAIEAISIQISLLLLNDNICSGVSCGISKKMFDFILKNNPYPIATTTHIFAYAWPILSDIIVKNFEFIQVVRSNNFLSRKAIFRYKDITSGILVNSETPMDLRNFGIFDANTLITDSRYIFTFRKL